jgi:hypothetical protein
MLPLGMHCSFLIFHQSPKYSHDSVEGRFSRVIKGLQVAADEQMIPIPASRVDHNMMALFPLKVCVGFRLWM